MKHFARCTNCRQWYVHNVTMLVDIVRGNGLHATTLWCVPCINAAEERSRSANDNNVRETIAMDATLFRPGASEPDTHGESGFHSMIQEHLDLMEQALHEDDDVLVPLIDDFMHRCHALREQLDHPDRAQRLSGHLQYWDTFLQALRRSS